jgi:hypothetical protein
MYYHLAGRWRLKYQFNRFLDYVNSEAETDHPY